jgi:CheY-like chemotaxis protein
MRPTIVCAEADAQLCEIHRQALTNAGFRVVAVPDGEQAAAAAEDEEVDALVIDTLLPRRDGFAVIEALRAGEASSRTAPAVLLCSGRISPETRKRAEAIGDVVLVSKPVSLEALIAHVRRIAKVSDARSNDDSRDRGSPSGSGSLREIHFGSLLHTLHGARASGVLFVENGKKKKAIEFRGGYPVAVKSNLVTECLGNMLERRGQLTGPQLDESLKRVKRGEGLQGEILVAMNVLDEDAVAALLREQAEAKLLEVFEWRRGRYQFQAGKKLQRANTLALSGSPASLIVEGARRHVALRRVDEFLAQHGKAFLTSPESPFDRFQSLELAEQESALIGALDRNRPLAHHLDAPEPVRRILYAMALTGLIELTLDAALDDENVAAVVPGANAASVGDESELRRELTSLAQSLREKNYYEVLDLPTTAGDVTVEAAYQRQIQRVHPDRYRASNGAVRQVADEIYKLFTTAYERIRNAEGRSAYAEELKRDVVSRRDKAHSRKVLSAETAFQRGEAALRQRDYEGALVFFGSAVEQRSDEGVYHAYYGWCLHLCHSDNEVMLHEAIEHVQNGMKLSRDHEIPYLFLGRLYKVVGKPAAAEKMFTRAVQIKSDCVEALRELRLLNMRRDKQRGLIGRILKR